MPTPESSRYVALEGAGSTLLVGSRAIRLHDEEGLGGVGESRGSDLEYAEEDGADAYPRYRGIHQVVLTVHMRGQWDQEGTLVAPAAQLANAESLHDAVAEFPDANARAFTLRWTRLSGVWTAVARFNRFGVWRNPAPRFHQVDMLIDIPDGMFTEVAP